MKELIEIRKTFPALETRIVQAAKKRLETCSHNLKGENAHLFAWLWQRLGVEVRDDTDFQTFSATLFKEISEIKDSSLKFATRQACTRLHSRGDSRETKWSAAVKETAAKTHATIVKDEVAGEKVALGVIKGINAVQTNPLNVPKRQGRSPPYEAREM